MKIIHHNGYDQEECKIFTKIGLFEAKTTKKKTNKQTNKPILKQKQKKINPNLSPQSLLQYSSFNKENFNRSQQIPIQL